MKLQNKLVLLSALFSATGLMGCSNDSDSCGLSEESCQVEGKTLDIDKCKCVEKTPQSCPMTQAMCASVNKTLDINKCECVDTVTTECDKTEDSCQSEGKILDKEKCECVDTVTTECDKTEDSCQSEGKTLDKNKCECVDTVTTECDKTEDSCQSEGKTLDKNKCECVDTITTGCTYGSENLQTGDKTCDADGNIVICNEDGSTSSTPCARGVCVGGDCIPRNCDDIADGQNTCQNLKLMVCDDGELVEADPGCSEVMLCRDGESECSNYNACDTIAHNANGCLEGNIVLCNDGETSLVEDCVTNDQFCAADPEAEGNFYCKSPDPTDCEWNGGLVEKDQTVCDGNILRTCSAEANTEFDAGRDCIELDPTKPVCDTNACREEKSCGPDSDIEPGSIVCNNAGTNKAECIDGELVDLTGDKACTARPNASSVCTFTAEANCSDACNDGFTDVNGTCERNKQCDTSKEKYNAITNTCECDSAKHWTGTAGSCTCDANYVQLGNACELKKTCDTNKETYNSATNACVCDDSKHFVGEANACQCENGYVLVGNACEPKKTCDTTKETYNTATNTCTCNTAAHWAGTAGSCTCETGYYLDGNTCKADDAQHCRGIDCTAVSYWVDGICNAEGQCQVTTCADGTHLYDNGTSKTCETNTAAHCGSHGNACGTGQNCVDGTCVEAGTYTPPSVGDIITFGHYEQDDDTTNGKEPITWRVLDIKDGKVLLISEKALDVQPYNTTNIFITWAESTIRSWLNGYAASYNTVGTNFTSDNFIDTAFTAEEKAKIIASNVPAHANPSYSTSPGSATTDKIFCSASPKQTTTSRTTPIA